MITKHEQNPDGTFGLSAKLVLKSSLKDVFTFFSDAFNLQKLTPSFLSFKVLTPPPIQMKVGALIDYKLKIHGFPIRWQTEITAWEEGRYFVDEQKKGPYQLWRHQHIFTETPAGIECCDEVTYKIFGGRLVWQLLVKKDVEEIFSHRQEILRKIFS